MENFGEKIGAQVVAGFFSSLPPHQRIVINCWDAIVATFDGDGQDVLRAAVSNYKIEDVPPELLLLEGLRRMAEEVLK